MVLYQTANGQRRGELIDDVDVYLCNPMEIRAELMSRRGVARGSTGAAQESVAIGVACSVLVVLFGNKVHT